MKKEKNMNASTMSYNKAFDQYIRNKATVHTDRDLEEDTGKNTIPTISLAGLTKITLLPWQKRICSAGAPHWSIRRREI